MRHTRHSCDTNEIDWQKRWSFQELSSTKVLWIFEDEKEVEMTNDDATQLNEKSRSSEETPHPCISWHRIRWTYDPDMIQLKSMITHGMYIALNCIPNQKDIIVSLFSWHQTYMTLRIMASIRTCSHSSHMNLGDPDEIDLSLTGMDTMAPTMMLHSQTNVKQKT